MRGLNPMTTDLVVADAERGRETICLAVSPSLKAKGVRNRCRVFEIPSRFRYIMATPRMQLYLNYAAELYSIYLDYFCKDDIFVYSVDEAFNVHRLQFAAGFLPAACLWHRSPRHDDERELRHHGRAQNALHPHRTDRPSHPPHPALCESYRAGSTARALAFRAAASRDAGTSASADDSFSPPAIRKKTRSSARPTSLPPPRGANTTNRLEGTKPMAIKRPWNRTKIFQPFDALPGLRELLRQKEREHETQFDKHGNETSATDNVLSQTEN